MFSELLLTAAMAVAQPTTASTEAFRFESLRVKDRIEADGFSRRTIEVSVLLRTPAAVQQFGQLGSQYVDGYGDVAFENVRITKPSGATSEITDGKIDDLNPFGINDAAIPVDIRFKKLTIPRLEPGDRLSYSLITTQRPFVPGDAYGEMKFTPVPVDGPQIYELDLPAPSPIKVSLRPGLGAEWEVLPGPANRLVRRLTITVPPMVVASTGFTEAQTTGLQTPDVSFTTFASWPKVGEWWWNMSRARLEGDEATKREATRLVAGKNTPREKIEAIASFVSTSVRYLNVGFGIGRMQPRSPASVLSSRYGDCKDKVGLLMAMSAAIGVEVRPVLIHSLRLDLQDDSPGPHQFDHVVAAAILGPTEKDWLWMDPTNSLSSPLTLMPTTRDKRALAIDPSGKGVVVRTPAAPSMPSRKAVRLTAKLDAGGLLRGRVRLDDRSDSEPNLRASFASVAPEQHAEMLKAGLARTWREARLSNVRTADPAATDAPFWVEFDFERDVAGIDSEKEWKLWVPDLGPILLPASEDTTARKPVVFDVGEVTFSASVELPENVAGRAPLSIKMNRPFASLSSNYSVAGQNLTVSRVFTFPVPSIGRDEVPAYEALLKAANTDREQDFTIGPVRTAAPAAAALHREGKAAYDKDDYLKAVALLQKAAAADPKLKDVHNDLGLALRDAKQYEEALAAFSKSVEADPFHERAYAERAYVLFEMGRDEEAEKDLLKQIEVAPFKEWSYERLARRRTTQSRHTEAAELWSKSLAIDPSDVDGWIALGWAYANSEQPTEARQAFRRAEDLGPRAGLGVGLGRGYARIGDVQDAGRVAAKDLPAIAKNVRLLTAENIAMDQLYWSNRQHEAWLLIGEAAAEAGDLPKAERFLKAAWEAGLLPQAAYSIGRLREKEGRLDVAAELWAAAATVGGWTTKPADFNARLDALRRKGFNGDGSQELARLRFLKVPGQVTTAFTEDVLVLISGSRVEALKNVSKRKESEAAPVLKRATGLEISTPWPEEPGKILRNALLICDPKSGCLVTTRIEGGRSPGPKVGTISIAKMTPADRSDIAAGVTTRLILSASYDLAGSEAGTVTLVVSGPSQQSLVRPQPTRKATPGKGTADFDVTFTAPAGLDVVRIHVVLAVDRSTSTVASAELRVRP